MMNREPDKEVLKVRDILEWVPGMTVYSVEKLVECGALKRLPLGKHRRFSKEAVRKAIFGEKAEG